MNSIGRFSSVIPPRAVLFLYRHRGALGYEESIVLFYFTFSVVRSRNLLFYQDDVIDLRLRMRLDLGHAMFTLY